MIPNFNFSLHKYTTELAKCYCTRTSPTCIYLQREEKNKKRIQKGIWLCIRLCPPITTIQFHTPTEDLFDFIAFRIS